MNFKEYTLLWKDKVDQEINRAIKDEERYKPIREFLARGGKRFRPILTLLTSKSTGSNEEQAMPYAAAIEMFHNFTLLHDDIEDSSELRRGKPTVHRIYGIPKAINLGDMLYTLVGIQLAPLDKKINKELWQAFLRVAEGQDEEISWISEERWELKEQDYFRMAGNKTGALIAVSCKVGSMLGKEHIADKMYQYGMKIGLAFQIQDDVLNLIGDEKEYKKEIGGDIQEGKRTLMVIKAIENGRKDLINIMRKEQKTKQEIMEAIEIMKQEGTIDYAKEIAENLSDEAKAIIDELEIENKEIFKEIADIVIKRKG